VLRRLHVSELVNKFTISKVIVDALLYGSGGLKRCGSTNLRLLLEKKPADTTHVAVDTSAAATTATTTGASTTPAGGTSGAVAMAPITGTTKTVNMVGDAKGYRFEPATFTIKQGDGVKFVVVSGGPHNVAFDPATIPADVKGQLDANMGTDKAGELSSNMKLNPGDAVTVSFGKIKPGQYPFHCVPHLALGMKGTITVQ
jgi:plastocyanin